MSSFSRSSVQRIARIYDARAEIPFDGSTYCASVASDLQAITGLPGIHSAYICDVGCGLGWHLDRLAHLGHRHLYGVDISPASLKQFYNRSDFFRAGLINVTLGDVRAWRVERFFDVVTAFLCCVGEYSRHGDLQFTRALLRLLRPGGYLVLTCFVFEVGCNLRGTTSVKYASSVPLVVTSSIDFSPASEMLTISQSLSPSGPKLGIEQIRLYSVEQLKRLLARAGFQHIEIELAGTKARSKQRHLNTHAIVIARRP
jgi:SAM-dependent methyltransferase